MTDFKTIKAMNGDLAYQYIQGDADAPPIIFLSGFKSDMMGSKAEWLAQYCVEHNRTFLRFDYFAHGQSDGEFSEFTIGRAVDGAMFMVDTFLADPAIVIGSSMGGWVGLRLMELIPDQIYGFIGIAAAPDFTAEIKAQLSDEQKTDLLRKGYFEAESGYEEPYIFTQNLLEDGDVHCMLNRSIAANKSVHLLQGKQDHAVPWEKAEGIKKMLGGHADITFVDDGDHSLSRPQDLALLKQAIEKMTS